MEKNIANSFAILSKDQTRFAEELRALEDSSEWVEDITPQECRVLPCGTSIEVQLEAEKNGLDPEMAKECAEGIGMFLSAKGKVYCLSDSAWATLCARAQLSGNALSKMPAENAAQTLSWGYEVGTAKPMKLLVRAGRKICALHSGTYKPMEMKALWDTTMRKVSERFGEMTFEYGYLSNTFMQCVYSLPGAREKVNRAYREAMTYAASAAFATDELMPCVALASSDTANAAATLTPLFKTGKRLLYMGGRLSVKHESDNPMEKFEKKAEALLQRFDDATSKIKEMAETTIHNPVNCIVGVFNHLGKIGCTVPRRFAEAARLECEMLEAEYEYLSAYDIYVCMQEALALAESRHQPQVTLFNLQENIASALKLDFTKFDIGGEVPWGDKAAY